MRFHLCVESEKNKTRNRLVNAENKLVVATGERGLGDGRNR